MEVPRLIIIFNLEQVLDRCLLAGHTKAGNFPVFSDARVCYIRPCKNTLQRSYEFVHSYT